jgi:hypothetical protein
MIFVPEQNLKKMFYEGPWRHQTFHSLLLKVHLHARIKMLSVALFIVKFATA